MNSFVFQTVLQTLFCFHMYLYLATPLTDHINVDLVSLIGDVKEPLGPTCTLGQSTLSASIERSARPWCDV